MYLILVRGSINYPCNYGVKYNLTIGFTAVTVETVIQLAKVKNQKLYLGN